MTSPEENVTPDEDEKSEIVSTPATPGAAGLPLPDDATPDPTED
jgi:hypothetical protein